MDSTEKHTEPNLAPIIDHKKIKGENLLSNGDDGIQYTTPTKLVAIMLTINLSTMIAALDLVGSPLHTSS
jgi:hypothetical protein